MFSQGRYGKAMQRDIKDKGVANQKRASEKSVGNPYTESGASGETECTTEFSDI